MINKAVNSENELAPIALFVYKRLDKLKEAINALLKNELASNSTLFIFSDNAKYKEDIPQIKSVRDYIKTITGFREIKIIESSINKGLAQSIIDGVTDVLKVHNSIIVLEDDLITTPNFLQFMNQSLVRYEKCEGVIGVSGFSFPFKSEPKTNENAYFLNRSWSWGWATWKNRWVEVDWEMKDYQDFLHNKTMKKEFSLLGSDVSIMLKRQMKKELDSWSIRWVYHQFKTKQITLYPLISKVSNEGFDGFATHTKGDKSRYVTSVDYGDTHDFNFPIRIEITEFYQKQFQSIMSVKERIISKIKTFLKIITKNA